MADKKETKSDIPAAEDVIDGTSSAAKSAATAKGKKAASQSENDVGLKPNSSPILSYFSVGLSIIAISWLAFPSIENAFFADSETDTKLPAWQIALDSDRAEFQSQIDNLQQSIYALDAAIIPVLDRLDAAENHLQQQLDAQNTISATLDADMIDIKSAIEKMRAEMSSLAKGIETIPQQPTTDSIWFDGLATASQFGQDLAFWKARIDTLNVPEGGWVDAQARILDALASAETASHQSLISAAATLVDARDMQRHADNIETSGWLSWASDLVQLRKLDQGPDDALIAMQAVLLSGDLVMVRDALMQLDGLDKTALQNWLADVDSRLNLDAVLSSNIIQTGGS